jgi:hypothetical protein
MQDLHIPGALNVRQYSDENAAKFWVGKAPHGIGEARRLSG